jgi:PAS domain S-box-containing protein
MTPFRDDPPLPGEIAVELLLEAGVALAASLDLETTMGHVARLTVPRLADLCVIDLLDEDGSIRRVAVAASDEAIARDLEELRMRYPLAPDGEHPVARVIRSGEPELLAQMSTELLSAFAAGYEHARFMIEQGYRSAVVAPLLARGRTLGAFSVLRLGEGTSYGGDDLALAGELARRAALAIDNASLFSDVRRVEQRLEAILASLAEAVTVIDEHGRTVFANQAAADLLGVATPSDLTDAQPGTIMRRFLVLDEHGSELDLDAMPARRLLRGEQATPLLVRNIVRATGEERWLIVRSSAIADAESARVLYAVNVLENITEVKRAQIAESFMAEASRMLASSLDYAETLDRVAQLAVPQIADWCAIDVLDEAGELERVAVHDGEPAELASSERRSRSDPHAPDQAAAVEEVIRTARTRLLSNDGPDAPANAQQVELLRALGARSMIIVPLTAPARTIGAITLICSKSRRRLTPADVGVAERLGRRAGTAVESARLYTERTRIASILQEALLPESLPEIPGVELAKLYHAAGELNEVGGDFYDVLDYGANRWMLVIGDVCGKGPRAAGVTALARHTLRAAAMLGQSPVTMLATLHEALRRQPPGADLCTVCLVTLEAGPTGARVTVARAGHPAPLILKASGEPTQLGHPGTLLGVLDPIDLSEAHSELRAGETLLLYTDGLAEAGHGARRLGERGLLELCKAAQPRSLPELLDHLLQGALELSDGKLRDDVALLGVRLSG